MLQRVSDYIADFLVKHNIINVFTVTGGGAMYLNDSFGHHSKMHCIYNHNEQASAIAAEAYARIDNKLAVVCVTTGPGATNAITGVVGGWMDSIPMLIISGQARYSTTVYASGLKLRTRGIQEFDIIGSVRNMTKYCQLVKNPKDIRYCLEKAIFLAKEGRPGPCWLDIPLDIQGAMIETEKLKKYNVGKEEKINLKNEVNFIINKINNSERPVLFVGNGVRLANAHEKFLKLVDMLNVPVVTGMSSIDAISTEHPLYVGRSGTTGDRAGNFAIQNSDLLISLGSRLSFFQTGFNYETWARGAYKIINDIDSEELKKDSINGDYNICCDVKILIEQLLNNLDKPILTKKDWVRQCIIWKNKYPVVLKKHYEDNNPNIYAFFRDMTSKLTKDNILVVSVGTSRVVGSQASIIKEGMRFITNPSTAAMGYCLPAAIGVSIAAPRKKIVLVTGEGSLQMNLQELQTIIHNKLPITIFVMNNQGYHSIRMTQKNYFKEPLVGVGPESGDISFPDLKKLSFAYGFEFKRCSVASNVNDFIDWALNQRKPCICEMMLSTKQITEPKVASKKLNNGRLVSATLENMAPFLDENELKENMYIPLLKDF